MSEAGEARVLWERHGLLSPRSRRVATLSAGSVRTRAEGFRAACLELGGHCQAFAAFLSGRADLLPFPFLEELDGLLPPFLGDPTRGIPAWTAAELEEIGASLYTRVFRGRLDGRPAVVELCCAPDQAARDAAWRSFERTIDPLEGIPESVILSDDVLAEFRSWLDVHADLQKKRQMLENLRQAPTGSLNLIPDLIPEFQTDELLAYEDLERICGLCADASRQTPLFVEAILEQILMLAFVALDAPWPEMRLLDEERVTFRVWPFMKAVPVQHYQSVLQYVASSIAEDGGRAMRMLLRIVRHEDGAVLESDLWRQLSGLRFEVASDHRISQSGEKLLEFWKALAAERIRRPDFLDLLHRELILVFRSSYDPGMDWIAPSASAVYSRLVTFRFSDAMSSDRAREWSVGSGLIALGVFRQVGAFLEQLRDNDFSVTVKTDSGSGTGSRRRPSVRIASFALLFLAALQGALFMSGSLIGHLAIVACLVFGTFFFVSASHGD